MPEAAVDENDFLVPWQDQIGLSGQVFPVQAKPVAHSVNERPDDHFRLGVFAPDAGHVVGASFGRMDVGQSLHLIRNALSVSMASSIPNSSNGSVLIPP